MRKYVFALFSLLFLFFYISSYGQTDTTQFPKIYSWSVDSLGQTIRQQVDTNMHSIQEFNPGLGNINLGHLGSPIRHNLFYQRQNPAFLFSKPYQDYFKYHQDAHYFKTRTPYTFLKFASGGRQDTEARLWVDHTQNINKDLNVGLDINLIGSQKFYENERSMKGSYLNFFGSYQKNNYSLHGDINLNSLSYNELGGIRSKEDFEVIFPRYIPGNIEDATTTIKDNSFNLTQTLSLKKTSLSELNVIKKLGNKETFQKKDTSTVKDSSDRMPPDLSQEKQLQDTLQDQISADTANVQKDLTRFYLYHRLTYSSDEKRYEDQNPLSDFYSKYPLFMDSTKTRDKARQGSLRNNFKLVYSNDFLTVHAGMDYNILNYSYTYPYALSDTNKDYDRLFKRNYTNASLSTGWDFHIDTVFSLWAQGRYYLMGFNSGDFNLKGGISKTIGKNRLTITGDYRYYEPDYFFNHYNSNHFRWNKKLSKISRLEVSGMFHFPSIKTKVTLKPAVIHDYTYLDTNAVPVQYHNNLNLVVASLEKGFQFWKFYSSNELVVQYTDRYDIMGIPKIYLHHRFAFRHKFHFNNTGGDLYTQAGWSLYYYPSYYADAYMPALGLFHRQQTEKIGNEPLFNLFANIRVKRVNLFVKLYHLNSYIQRRDYYAAPLYPMSPMMLKLGVSWSFYD